MNKEGNQDEVLITNYCIACRTFFNNFCYCIPNSNNAIVATRTLKSGYVNLLSNFLVDIAIIVYDFIATVLNQTDSLRQPLDVPNNIVSNHLREISCEQLFFSSSNQATFPNNCIDLINQKYNSTRCVATKTSFYLYMLTVHLQGEDAENQQSFKELSSTEVTERSPRSEIVPNTSSSALSLTSKLSGTGGMLSNWIHRSKKKKGRNEQEHQIEKGSSASENSAEENSNHETQPQSNEILVKKSSSKSKIPLRKPMMKLGKRNFTDEESQMLLSKVNRRSPWFFRKLKPKTGRRSISTESSACESPSSEKVSKLNRPCQEVNTIQVQTNSNTSLKVDSGCNSPTVSLSRDIRENYCLKSCSSYDAPQGHAFVLYESTYFNLTSKPTILFSSANSNPILESNLSDKLRDVMGLSSRVHESELHLTHIIGKYIQDHSLEKELLDTISNHAKLHLEAERRAQSLAYEMWSQQSELMRNQEMELQESIKVLVRENRKLQQEVDNLTRRNEKLYIKVSQFPDRHRLCDSGSQVIENLSRNNDKLRYKTSVMLTQIEDHEKSLHRMRRKSDSLEQLLRNSNSQLHTCKAILQRTQADHELEYANMSRQLQIDQTIIKESVEAGDVVLEDLDGLKRQLKAIPCTLNWTKLKSRGNSLPDLIYMCRSCINELTKELLHARTDITLKEKDNTILKEEIVRHQKCLEASKSEQERLKDQLETLKTEKVDLQKCYSKCSDLERELSVYRQNSEKMMEDLRREKSSLTASAHDMGDLKRKVRKCDQEAIFEIKPVIEKDEELSLSKEKMSEYKSENDAIRMQLHGLKQILSASGSGDVARELADTQEKLTFFQSQYYQLLSEKNYLMEQVQTANIERGAMNDFQANYYQFIQIQQQDLELLSKENQTLKQQLETECSRSSIFRAERTKLKEEKNVMRKIYHQLKNEINRVQQLEGEVVGMNMEANRLAIIAEYNKQLGEKLQCEVAERDVKISELQSNMEELNMAQMENAKDKVALCVELSEVCTINDKLNHSLLTEQHKSVHLDKTKKKLEDTANTQLKAVEEMQKAERAALKDLLRDYKIIVKQRDNLLASQTEYLQQISDFRANAVIQARNAESTNYELMQNLEIISNFRNKIQHLEHELVEARDELTRSKNYNSQQQLEIEKFKEQKETFETSKKYLQNTLQKVHNDLNESMRTEVEMKLAFENRTQKMCKLQTALERSKADLAQASEESKKMAQKISEFNGIYEELVAECKRADDINYGLKNDLDEAKVLVQIRTEDIRSLENAYAKKQLEVIEMRHYTDNLTEQLKIMETSVKDIDLQSRLLSESNSKQVRLKDFLETLQREHDQCTETVSVLQQENDKLQRELKEYVKKMELHCAHYRKYIEGLIKDYTEQKKSMEGDLQNLARKFQELEKEYADHKNLHSNLVESHKDLAAKLLRAIRMLVDEKLGAEASVTSLSQQNLRLASEKAAVENTVGVISNDLRELKVKFEDLTADKMSIQAILSDLQKIQRQAQSSTSEFMAIHNIEPSCSNTTLLLTDAGRKLEEFVDEDRYKQLKDDLEDSHKKVIELTIQISNLKQELTVMEFKKSEVVLRLHETEAKLKVEQNISRGLMETSQTLLSEVLEMEQDGSITRPVSEALVNLLQGRESSKYWEKD